MRVREYLRLYGQLYGIADPSRGHRGRPRALPDLAPRADAMGTELSSGQRTLIGIVRATLHRPRLLILDEPTASLDPDVALRVRQGLLELVEERRHRAADDEPRHERRRARLRARACSCRTAASSPTARPHDDRRVVRARRPRRRVPPPRRRPRGVGGATNGPPMTATRTPIEITPSGSARSWLRMRAIARRHAYVLVRSPHRLFDVTLWPLVDVLLFGSLAAFVGDAVTRPPARRRPATCSPASCSGTSSTSRRSR